MLSLAIDQSTATGSAAILADGRLLAARQWSDARSRRQMLFPSLKSMLDEAGLEPAAIQLYVVGVGPGSYGGLRTALMACRAMALPGRTPVYGIVSAEALAFQAAEEGRAARVRVVGDARRDQWWTRSFTRKDESIVPSGDWELVHPRAFMAAADQVIATPDWERIGGLLQAAVVPPARLIARALLPDAATLGRLACARAAQGVASAPLAPIYLHPAVNVTTGEKPTSS